MPVVMRYQDPSSGLIVVTSDDLGGLGSAQYVKLMSGVAGEAYPVAGTVARGLSVEPLRNYRVVNPDTQPAVQLATAYAQGTALGAKLTFSGFTANRPVKIEQVRIVDRYAQLRTLAGGGKPGLLMFKADFTAPADATPIVTLSQADCDNIICSFDTGSPKRVGPGTPAFDIYDLCSGVDWTTLAVPTVADGAGKLYGLLWLDGAAIGASPGFTQAATLRVQITAGQE